MVRQFQGMIGMRQILFKDYESEEIGIKGADKDKILIITGSEGMGKSNVALWLFDYWYTKVLKKEDYDETYLRYFGTNKSEFLGALRSCESEQKRYQMIVHDEAGKDFYSRKAMSSFSTDINIAYQVIRGMNLYTILIIPNILDLDSFFRKRRVSSLIHVYGINKRHQVTQFAFYHKRALAELIPELSKMSERNANPNPLECETKPLFLDSCPWYKGIIRKPYAERKENNMKQTIVDLQQKYVEKKKYDKRPMYQANAEKWYKLHVEKGMSLEKIRLLEQLGNSATVSKGIKFYRLNFVENAE